MEINKYNFGILVNKSNLLSTIKINMSEKIAKIISERKPELSSMSVKTYASCISKVLEFLETEKNEDLYLDAHKVIKLLNEKYDKSNTIKTKLASIIVFLRIVKNDENTIPVSTAIDIYSSAVDLLTIEIKNKLASCEKTEKQKDNWISPDEDSKLHDYLFQLIPDKINTPKELLHLRNYIIYKFYQVNATRNEIADSKIIFSPTKVSKPLSLEHNYIILDKKKKTINYQMNKYKTFKSYGQKNIDIDKNLYPLFLSYKKAVELFNKNNWFLLNDSANDKLTRNRLGVIYSELGKSIGKKLGTSLNRHITISNLIPVEQIKDLADKMCHSSTEAILVYAKV